MADNEFEEQFDEMDLSPRDLPAPKRSYRNWVVVGVLLAAGAFVITQALGSAAVFYLNVDEAQDRSAELEDEVFRMQGSVITEPATNSNGAIQFQVGWGGATQTVSHVGEEPTDLFALGQSVIVEGRFIGDVFQSTQILVKHSENYVADNEERDGVGL